MAKKNSKSDDKNPFLSASVSSKKGIAFFLAFISVCLFVSMATYEPRAFHSAGSLAHKNNPEMITVPLLGELGNFFAYYAFAFGGISSWIIPWFLFAASYLYLFPTSKILKFKRLGGLSLAIISVSLLADLHFPDMGDPQKHIAGSGGYLGKFLYGGLPLQFSNQSPTGICGHFLGPLGSTILGWSVLILSVPLSFSSLNQWHKLILGFFTSVKKGGNDETRGDAPDGPETSEVKSRKVDFKIKTLFAGIGGSRANEDDLLFGDVSKNQKAKEIENESSTPVTRPELKKSRLENSQNLSSKEDPFANSDETEASTESTLEEKSKSDKNAEDKDHAADNTAMDGFKVVRAAKTEKSADLFPERKGDYHFPTLDLLMNPPEEEASEDEDHMIKAKNLKETLSEFKVDIELGEVHTGPVITRYDVHPAAGVRVEKIANLDKNLAMALRADSVRILAPVPGKGCVGIEVPNQNPAAVCLKEILQSKAWADSGAEIPIVLGKEASGRALVADLTKMPHLLVAGSTGSGKTVCINAIIASLCYHSSPEDVRFIMVDPKIVEMKVYNDLPHMLIPVVTEPKKVPGALKWLLVEMERRYQIFSKIGVRNIAGFNAKILHDKEEREKAQALDAEMTAEERAALSSIQVPRDDDALEIPENKLPYIVCIIDELADLMMVAQADVETGIARLAQLARAAGIHLIIATQRPSVNVITGVIKANLPSRISFRVASYRDSQTILDGKGAEALIGRGDMLFIPPGSSTFVRAQGAFVSDDEINGIVDYLKVNGPPQIIEEVREQIDSAGEEDVLGQDGENNDEDPMIRKAIEVIRATKRASTSNLQRKLSIGYNRAARIMDDLEDRGLVGPDVPGQGREILMDL